MHGRDYLLGQALSLVFYIITMVIYNRARKEYVGGKIAAAINLIMIFLVILFLTDFVDYFFILILPLKEDTILIIKILLKLVAICVLFFGGLRFFVSKHATPGPVQQSATIEDIKSESPQSQSLAPPEPSIDTTAVPEDDSRGNPTLGRYEIIEQIGKGAMGIVYKGRDPRLNRLTAIKTIRFIDEFDEDQVKNIREHFYHEAEVVAKLSHSNIVTVYDVGEDLDLSYLAMEYLEGESLEKYTRAGSLFPVEKVIDVITQVCDALAYAHNHGIIHRDIKPANIMILKNGLIKVTDFGIARAMESSKTRTGIIKGTPYYMSPEQTMGIKLTGQSDIFSLGVVFYQLLTGRLPFDGENIASIMYQIANVDPEPPATYVPDINKATEFILNQSLERNIEKRYQTAKQMGDHLRLLTQKLMPGIGFEKEDLDFSDLEQIQEGMIDNGGKEGPVPILEGFDGVHEIEETMDLSVSAVESDQKEDLDFSDLEQLPDFLADNGAKKEEGTGLKGFNRVSEIEETMDLSVSEVEPKQKEDPDFLDLKQKMTAGALSKVTLPMIISCCLVFLVLSGIFYFFWKSSYTGDILIKKPNKQVFKFTGVSPTVKPALKKDKELKKQDVPAKIGKKDLKEQESLVKIKEEKREEQKRLDKIKEELKKEQEQLARIREEKQNEQKRLAKIEKEKQRERERLQRIEEEKRNEQELLAKIKQEKKDALKHKELSIIENIISKARESLKIKKYLEAQKGYNAALKIIDHSDFKEEGLFLKHKNEIKEALMNEDIIYGSKGYIKFRNKWITPEEYENILYKEGFVKYKGNFINYMELKNIITQLTYPGVQTFLTSKYSGQLIHKKQIKFHKLVLNKNTGLSSHYTVFYRWEVWTFKETGEGTCSNDIYYAVEKDQWIIARGCEQ